MKTCFKCNVPKPESEFYRHPQMKDGLLGKCKECTKRDTAKRAEEKPEVIRAYERKRATLPHRVEARKAYSSTSAGRLVSRKVMQKQRSQHPDKYKANNAVNNAVRDGRLIRRPCSVCGSAKSEGHHPNYSKPLEVEWLCKKHHRAEHKKLTAAASIVIGFPVAA